MSCRIYTVAQMLLQQTMVGGKREGTLVHRWLLSWSAWASPETSARQQRGNAKMHPQLLRGWEQCRQAAPCRGL